MRVIYGVIAFGPALGTNGPMQRDRIGFLMDRHFYGKSPDNFG